MERHHQSEIKNSTKDKHTEKDIQMLKIKWNHKEEKKIERD
jgi:hypothetical protein